jgi:hypothetical protein
MKVGVYFWEDLHTEQIQDASLGHAKKQAAALVRPKLVAGMSLIGTEGIGRVPITTNSGCWPTRDGLAS